MKTWLFNILVALDRLLNAVLRGNPDETVTVRAGKARLSGKTWACVLCKLLDRLDKNHCAKAVEGDKPSRA